MSGERDYTTALRQSVAREVLAQAIYDARTLYHFTADDSVPAYRSLLPRCKDPFRAEADLVLARVQPQPRGLPPVITTGLRVISGGRLLGAIEPQKGA